jgi:hypothetical protein
MEDKLPLYLTYRTIEERLGFSAKVIKGLVARGAFVDILLIGSRHFFETAEVMKWVEAQRV